VVGLPSVTATLAAKTLAATLSALRYASALLGPRLITVTGIDKSTMLLLNAVNESASSSTHGGCKLRGSVTQTSPVTVFSLAGQRVNGRVEQIGVGLCCHYATCGLSTPNNCLTIGDSPLVEPADMPSNDAKSLMPPR
jgi:hypothetical protein